METKEYEEVCQEMITASDLANRVGWSRRAIAKFLPDPCKTAPNPMYRCAPNMKLYCLKRIQATERAADFEEWRAKCERRKQAAKLAGARRIEREKQSALEKISEVFAKGWLTPKRLSTREIRKQMEEQLDAFNQNMDWGRNWEPKNLYICIRTMRNHVRHQMTNYDYVRAQLGLWKGTTAQAKEIAYEALREKVESEIDNVYPELIGPENEIPEEIGQ